MAQKNLLLSAAAATTTIPFQPLPYTPPAAASQAKKQHGKRKHAAKNNDKEKDFAEEEETEQAAEHHEKAGHRGPSNFEFFKTPKERNVVFRRRAHGLINKAYEASAMSGSSTLLVTISETGVAWVYATAGPMRNFANSQAFQSLLASAKPTPESITRMADPNYRPDVHRYAMPQVEDACEVPIAPKDARREAAGVRGGLDDIWAKYRVLPVDTTTPVANPEVHQLPPPPAIVERRHGGGKRRCKEARQPPPPPPVAPALINTAPIINVAPSPEPPADNRLVDILNRWNNDAHFCGNQRTLEIRRLIDKDRSLHLYIPPLGALPTSTTFETMFGDLVS